MKIPSPLEAEDGANLAVFLQYMQNLGKIKLYTHVPNETYTKSWAAKLRNKRQGVRRGMLDYIVVTNDLVIFLELKRETGGIVSKEQAEWIIHLNGKQTVSQVCNGYDDARRFIEKYLV